MIEHALIFSAGRGERLYPFTKNCPKPLLNVHGHPALFWHIKKLESLAIKTIFINHAYLGDQIKATVRATFPSLDIQFLPEPPGGLETGGTLAFFKQELTKNKADLLCINADIFTDYLFELDTQLNIDEKAKLILVPQENCELKGNFDIDNKGYILNSSHPKYVFSGIAYYHHLALLELPLGRYSIRNYLFKWIFQKEITGHIHQGIWLDIGSVDTWFKVQQPLVLPADDY